MTAFVVNSEESLQRCLGDLRGLFAKHKYLRLNVKTGKDRSGDQNRIFHVWMGQLARELPEHDELGWKCFCKLHYAIPILRMADEDYRAKYDATVNPMSYEQKITIMEFWPATSVMTVEQLSACLDKVQAGIYHQYRLYIGFPDNTKE